MKTTCSASSGELYRAYCASAFLCVEEEGWIFLQVEARPRSPPRWWVSLARGVRGVSGTIKRAQNERRCHERRPQCRRREKVDRLAEAYGAHEIDAFNGPLSNYDQRKEAQKNWNRNEDANIIGLLQLRVSRR
jgi:hypothetical protein